MTTVNLQMKSFKTRKNDEKYAKVLLHVTVVWLKRVREIIRTRKLFSTQLPFSVSSTTNERACKQTTIKPTNEKSFQVHFQLLDLAISSTGGHPLFHYLPHVFHDKIVLLLFFTHDPHSLGLYSMCVCVRVSQTFLHLPELCQMSVVLGYLW